MLLGYSGIREESDNCANLYICKGEISEVQSTDTLIQSSASCTRT